MDRACFHCEFAANFRSTGNVLVGISHLKKLPALPKGPSTSGKAEPYLPKWALSGEAKHSKPAAIF
jgi:hypothetical protein